MARLGDLIKPAKVIRCDNSNYPVLSMTMHDGIILQSSRFKKSIASTDQSNYKVVQYGQLVVGFPIDEGVLYIQKVKTAGIMSPAYNVWDVETALIDINYLEYCLHSPQSMQFYKANLRGTTARRRSIPTDILLELFIPLPSLDEQRRIAVLLDKVSDLIAKRRAQLDKLDLLVKARFVEVMENSQLGDKTTIENITQKVKVGFVGTCEQYYTDETGIPMIRTGNITEHGIDMTELKYVTTEFHKKNKKSQIQTGDLLIARHGSNGQANVYYGPVAQCLNAVIVVPDSQMATSIFLANLINSSAVREQIEKTLVGSTQRVINTKSIAKIVVRIPDLSVQRDFENTVLQIGRIALALRRGISQLETLKKALMQQYFG